MKAEIMAVGTELLLGDIVNTNAQFIAKELAALGISVYRQSVVGDNAERLREAIQEGFKRADIIITTGGLGPTKDDLTKETASEYFGRSLVTHQESMEAIEDYFKKTGRSMTESNKKQAYFPEGAVILKNNNGTAPGCILEQDGKTIILLPGPPKEMIPMFKEGVVPYLEKLSDGVLVSKVLRICGIGESQMEEEIRHIIEGQSNPTVAPYAKENEVTLRITAKAAEKQEAEKLIVPVEESIRAILGKHIYGVDDCTLEDVVGELLIEKGLTISTAESCTGGLIAGTLINYPGISAVLSHGLVTYSNEAKMQLLGVKQETLDKYGAVSEETAREMVQGLISLTGTRVGISVTGIAGPGGGTEEKPVGLVYAGLYIDGRVMVRKFNFAGNRQKVRNRTVVGVLDWLRREIL
ncbi:MAG: competence/damage-inducible protein A [Bacillota bacterium]|nr:competence/damage-inducible protein A [Bacillota bacterium]